MKLFPRLFLFLSLGLATTMSSSLLAPRAFAQVAGSIIGNVIDESGNPIGGVRIQARSETQIGGAKTTYTATDGSFRLPSLQPGTFEVRASAPKLKDVLQR